MPSRRSAHDQVSEVARRRLEQLSSELAELRADAGRPRVASGAHAASPSAGAHAADPAAEPAESAQPAEQRSGAGRAHGAHAAEPAQPFRRLDDVTLPAARLESPALSPPPRSGEQPAQGRHAQRSLGPGGRLAGWLEERMPPGLRGRWLVGLGHLAVLAAFLLVALGVTAWWLARADRSGVPLPPVATPATDLVPLARSPSVSAPAGPSLPGSPSGVAGGPVAGAPGDPGDPGDAGTVGGGPPDGAPSGRIVVDVAGRVRRPGIATLPAGSRVVDALRAAGGARRGVRLGSLNLARVLTDGEQILVGVAAPTGLAASAASAASGPPTGPATGSGTGSAAAPPLVNINTGSETELESLPGVGPVTAQAIVQYRTDNGPFTSVDELVEVSGIGDATLAKIAPFVTL